MKADKIQQKKPQKAPPLLLALMPLLISAAALALSVFVFETEPHLSILLGGLVAGLIAYIYGFTIPEIEQGMKDSIARAIPSLIILLIIGMIISTWIASGIVPALIYFGLDFIVAKWFLPSILLLCIIMSVLTGSSWTTIGTIGVAAIGMGQGVGLPAGPVAGAIVSGAFFGDKLSPLSDSTNLTSAIVKVDLYDHIKHMLYTTIPAALLSLGLFSFIGFSFADGADSAVAARNLQMYLQEHFVFSLWLLIPPCVVIAMIVKKTPPIPSLLTGVMLGVLVQVFIQGQAVEDVLHYLYHGYSISTDQSQIDALLSGGGLESMYSVVILGILSLAFGGIMNATGMLEVIVKNMKQMVKNQGRLVLTTLTTSIMVNIIGANQYLAVILPGQMYENCYKKLNLHRKNLSRALESGGTLTAPLVPWNTSGVFILAVLGVDALTYAPFAFICWITMIITAIFSFANFAMEKE